MEHRLSDQINYLSVVATAQWHGDCVYGDEKRLDLTCQRTELIEKGLYAVVDALEQKNDTSNEKEERMDVS